MKKYLGQHILINKTAIQKVIDSIGVIKSDTIIEIGPGTGALTIELIKTGAKIIAIEKDKEMVGRLKNKLEIMNYENAEIIGGDALKLLPQLIDAGSQSIGVKVVGNIPYYITGQLFRVLSELEHKPSLIVLTIQREVAERIAAKPPKINLLAAITQFWARVEILDYLKPEDFNPAPEVNSAIIRLTPGVNQLESERYFEFVKILFKQPRKTIVNNLTSKSAVKKYSKEAVLDALKNLEIGPKERAQNLTVEKMMLLLDKLKFDKIFSR